MNDEIWRCFVGVPIGEPLRAELRTAVASLQAGIASDPDELRWTDPPAWHLTLAFLGATAASDVRRLGEVLRQVAGEHAPFTIATGGLGAFPSRRDVRILWYGLADRSRRLAELAVAVRLAVGTETSSPFRAHLTLARARGDRGVAVPAGCWATPMPAGQVAVEELTLYRSHLGRGPARYEVLATAPLGLTLAGTRAAP
ncbi:MAG TPA: RNA 2',3'-cyclic phosphodiesterase [Candidatus Limnocylindria bacterium]|nr:RNA 2',3'-cyclic phosphodiesterase [Candidatus Limnocylindria bacterium]